MSTIIWTECREEINKTIDFEFSELKYANDEFKEQKMTLDIA